MASWDLAIDFGTTQTAAAVSSGGEVVPLVFSDSGSKFPSLIWIDEGGVPRVGALAVNQYRLAPEMLVPEPKSLLGLLETAEFGGKPFRVTSLVGALLETVFGEAAGQYGGSPEKTFLTHPVEWGDDRKGALVEAAGLAGIKDPVLVSEPHAAASRLASDLPVGRSIAVYDLGGGTFDVAVLNRTEKGFALLAAGGSDPIQPIGGERFDGLLLRLIGDQVSVDHPETWAKIKGGVDAHFSRLRIDLRNEARKAKEALSRQETFSIPMPDQQPGMILINRSDMEELIEPDIRRSFDKLDEVISQAGTTPDELHAIYLTGGSSRLRLVSAIGHEKYGEKLKTKGDPKSVVALGALNPMITNPEPAPAPSPVTPDPPEPVLVPPKPVPRPESKTEVAPAPPFTAPPRPPRTTPVPQKSPESTPTPTGPTTNPGSKTPIFAVLGVLGVLLVGGIAIGFGSSGDPGGSSDSSPPTIPDTTIPDSTIPDSSSSDSISTDPADTATQEPLNPIDSGPGPDKACGSGIEASSATSCPFATDVASAFAETAENEWTVDVYSGATDETYRVECGEWDQGGYWVCRGGNNAAVFIPW